MIDAVSDKIYGKFNRLRSASRGKSPFHEMETKLYQELIQHRSHGRKVSRRWIQIKGKKIQVELDKVNGTHLSRCFKASSSWFWRFLRRKNIRFRKRKSGKKKSTDDNLPAIIDWYTFLRHNVLPNQPNKPCKDFSEKWGRFPPKLRYNFDQVPLPFVVSQDETYTTVEDTDVHVAGHGKGDLRKRQFTMNIYINAGEGEDADGYVELICKGNVLMGTRFSATERAAWHKEVPMWFQKNAWMDRNVMAKSAETFREHIKKRWDHNWKEGDTVTSVLVICDNLDAHVAPETREVFAADQTVFVCYLPPSVTEAIQPIDAGFGRSLRCGVGRRLDSWLMEESNLELWEAGMTASQRRVLISNIVAEAMKEALADDKMRAGCFERTGCLLTLDGSGDEKIRPQGCSKSKLPLQIPQALVDLSYDPNQVDEVVTPEEEAGLVTPDDEEINFGEEPDAPSDVVVFEEKQEGEEVEEAPVNPPAEEEEEEEEEEVEEEEEGEGPSLQDPEEQELLAAALGKRTRKRSVRYVETAY